MALIAETEKNNDAQWTISALALRVNVVLVVMNFLAVLPVGQ